MGKRKCRSSLAWSAGVAAGLGLTTTLTGDAMAAGRSHATHVHGEAYLLVALEGNSLEMTLESPAANIVGFEHPASTSVQVRTVQSARATLEAPLALFTFIGTSCALKQAVVDVTALVPAADGDLQRSQEQGSDPLGSHSVVRAGYRFECKDGPGLRAISADFLGHSFAIGKLHAQWITDARQGAAELTTSSRIIELR